jgi:uncharacterized membrane protein
MWFLGIVIGGILGAAVLSGFGGGLAGALIGLIVALAMRSRSQIRQREAAARASSPMWTSAAVGNAPAPDISARLARMEERLRLVEARLGLADAASPPAESFATPPSIAAAEILPGVSVPAPVAAASVTALQPESLPMAGATAFGTPLSTPILGTPGASRSSSARSTPNPVWAWLTGGNALTRIGVVVLFFGVGFLLRYFARYFTVPIELRLAGVALAGAGLIGLGIKLGVKRPGYGLSLQGAGAGVLYLTAFAAFRFYEILPATAALALLALTAVLTVWLALRNDSQPLVGLAIAGGFLAPILVDAHVGGPALLFGYFAVLNAAIFAVAWVRAWRALNVLGFLFTFVLGFLWGYRYYAPEFFATVEPFLCVFFAFYVAIAILYARRAPLTMRAPVDALLVFGVPLTGFILQCGLMRDSNHGVAWSALGVALVYGALSVTLRKRREPGLPLLARAFLALAIIFATISIPFAVDARWTSAWWALEGAGVYWMGCAQRQPLARAFALLLQAGAAAALFLSGVPESGRLFVNASFFGAALIAAGGLATSRIADRAGDRIGPTEHALSPWIFGWAVLWWVGGGALEIHQHVARGEEGSVLLVFVMLSAAVALSLRGLARWPRLGWFGAALLPVMALVAWKNWQDTHTTLLAWGWVIWPVAWAIHWWALRSAEPMHSGEGASENEFAMTDGILRHAHTLSAIALVAWTSWEASEWVGRYMPQGTTWMACAAAWPAIAYLGLAVHYAGTAHWPLARFRDAYLVNAGTTIAALLGVWFAIVNVVSPGSPAPLPYAPVVNPLDVTLVATLACLWSWAREYGRLTERTRYGWLGVAIFLFVNAIVFRTMYQWADVPWRWSAMLASRPLQAALTLTWTATALPLMVIACRKSIRPLWMAGAALLAGVVGKLFLVDLAALSGLPRVVAFLGVGVLLLLIGYLAPLPPALSSERATSPR